jgi:hypothetical protein
MFRIDSHTKTEPERTQVRINPQHPFACRKRRLNGDLWDFRLELVLSIPVRAGRGTEWGGPLDETRKNETPSHSWCGTKKIPPCSKALSAEHNKAKAAALHRQR